MPQTDVTGLDKTHKPKASACLQFDGNMPPHEHSAWKRSTKPATRSQGSEPAQSALLQDRYFKKFLSPTVQSVLFFIFRLTPP